MVRKKRRLYHGELKTLECPECGKEIRGIRCSGSAKLIKAINKTHGDVDDTVAIMRAKGYTCVRCIRLGEIHGR